MDFDAPSLKQMPLPPRQPAVTLTSWNLIGYQHRLVNILCKFHPDCPSHSWDIVVTRSVWMNRQIGTKVNRRTQCLHLQCRLTKATCYVSKFVLHFMIYGSKVSNSKSDLQSHSRALVVVPFDRPYTISYQFSIATMSLSCTVSEIPKM